MRFLVGCTGARPVVRVRVETPLKPTEVAERVEAACTRFFPGARVQTGGGCVVAEASDLSELRRRVWELRIIDAFRGRLLAGVAGDGRSLAVVLSKQAAYAGRVSFPPTPHVLGDLHVTVTLDGQDPWADAEALAWWLCPETRDGEIVGPTQP